MTATDSGLSRARLDEYAREYGFSVDGVAHLAGAVTDGGADMAMFDHPDFAGPGQWMRGGLIMITAAHDTALRNRIDALCHAISADLRSAGLEDDPTVQRADRSARAWDVASARGRSDWPPALGSPGISADNGDIAYAYFPARQRLAIRRHGHVQVFDTGDQVITGVSQTADTAGQRLVFTTTRGELSLAELERPAPDAADNETSSQRVSEPKPRPAQGSAAESPQVWLDAIERLGQLHAQGVLTDEEFSHQKTVLLARL